MTPPHFAALLLSTRSTTIFGVSPTKFMYHFDFITSVNSPLTERSYYLTKQTNRTLKWYQFIVKSLKFVKSGSRHPQWQYPNCGVSQPTKIVWILYHYFLQIGTRIITQSVILIFYGVNNHHEQHNRITI